MFLSVEWAKRWLPTIFLLLSLFLPWWMSYFVLEDFPSFGRPARPTDHELSLSFPWNDYVIVQIYHQPPSPSWGFYINIHFSFYRFPVLCFVSALIFVSGLCGLSVRSKIRNLGGLLGIAGVVSYFAFIFPESGGFRRAFIGFPYFGSFLSETSSNRIHFTWFLSVGFFLALAGSLMLLSPLIRTLIEKLKKRLKSS